MHEISPQLKGGVVIPSHSPPVRVSTFETKMFEIPAHFNNATTSRLLTDEAEYGKWELMRVVLYRGGSRHVWFRRRVIRIQRGNVA